MNRTERSARRALVRRRTPGADRGIAYISGGVEMRVFVSGAVDGPPVVLVHGIGMGHAYWGGLSELLGAHRRVIAVDLPGFGESPDPEKSMSMAETGAYLVGFLRDWGLVNTLLIGHSMGTQIVGEAAAQAPELLGGVGLFAPTVNRDERSAIQQSLRLMQDATSLRPTVAYYGIRYYLMAGPRWYFAQLGRMIPHRAERAYARITAPTLVVRGERDPLCPPDWCASVTAMIPGAQMRTLHGHGHETMITGYEEVYEKIVERFGTGHLDGEIGRP